MANFYNHGLYRLLDNASGFRWNDAGVTIKCALVTSSYSYSSLHNYYSDISGECSNPNYVAGGNAVTGRAITEIDGTNRVKATASNVVWTALGVGDQPYAAVLYHDTLAGVKPLICYNRLTAPVPAADGSDFSLIFSSDGIFTITNS